MEMSKILAIRFTIIQRKSVDGFALDFSKVRYYFDQMKIQFIGKFMSRTFIKFALTGLSGVFVNLGSFQLMLNFGVHKLLASPIAIELSIISNFLLNNYWTFRDRALAGRKRVRGLKFNLVSLVTLTLSYSTFVLLSFFFPSVQSVILQGCAIAPATLFNYSINSLWTFREVTDGRPEEQEGE